MVTVVENLDPDISSSLQAQCIKEVSTRLQLQKDKQVILTPRMIYDLIIDVQDLSAQDCAQKIVNYLHTGANYTTTFFDNITLPKPINYNTLKVVPAFSYL